MQIVGLKSILCQDQFKFQVYVSFVTKYQISNASSLSLTMCCSGWLTLKWLCSNRDVGYCGLDLGGFLLKHVASDANLSFTNTRSQGEDMRRLDAAGCWNCINMFFFLFYSSFKKQSAGQIKDFLFFISQFSFPVNNKISGNKLVLGAVWFGKAILLSTQHAFVG